MATSAARCRIQRSRDTSRGSQRRQEAAAETRRRVVGRQKSCATETRQTEGWSPQRARVAQRISQPSQMRSHERFANERLASAQLVHPPGHTFSSHSLFQLAVIRDFPGKQLIIYYASPREHLRLEFLTNEAANFPQRRLSLEHKLLIANRQDHVTELRAHPAPMPF